MRLSLGVKPFGPGPGPKFDPSAKSSGVSLSVGNRQADYSSGIGVAVGITSKTYGGGGKWYWETKIVADGSDDGGVGMVSGSFNPSSGARLWTTASYAVSYRPYYGRVYFNQVNTETFATAAAGDTLMQAFDVIGNKWWIGKNGTWFNSGNPAAGTGNAGTVPSEATFYQAVCVGGTGAGYLLGAEPLLYTIPSGFTHWITP